MTEAEKETTGDNTTSSDNMTVTTTLPRAVIRQLRISAAQADTTIRVEILKSLIHAGYQVNESELVDKRKSAP